MKRTVEDQAILNGWPVVTGTDIVALNDLFPHYLFFRPGRGAVEFYASCCGHEESLSHLRRTEWPWETALLDACKHDQPNTCPWCGRAVTMKDLRRAGKRKKLDSMELALLLHARDNVLYADALCLRKVYETDAGLTAKPEYWLSSGYRFSFGDVMEIDYQDFGSGTVTHERGRLGRRKLVQEPFKKGFISWYSHEPYAIVNQGALNACPSLRYCQFFGNWQYRPGGSRGYAKRFHDFISYLTVYCMYPRQIELLVKAGLFEPVKALVYDRKRFADAICWEEPDIRKAMDLDKRELGQLIALQPPMDALTCRAKAKRWHGLSWDVSEALEFYNLFGSQGSAMEVLKFCRDYGLDPERLLRYLDGQKVVDADLPWLDMPTVFELYRDYLDTAYCLGFCLEHSKVLWPDNLQRAHDRLTERCVSLQQQGAAGRDGLKQFAADTKERKLKYEFELDGLRVVFPLTARAIESEGKKLSHCVGGYAARHMKGILTILFLRKTAAPSVPYVTIEMRGNSIAQIHGYRNDIGVESPRVRHKEFLRIWLEWLKKGSPRDKEGNPKIPGKKKGAA